ncbi:hypothetical protein [Amycolatopsis nigrescens]|uniref:hypothetical protein n=1 Tax=Amycolatopsis nigrescens TaxID=381445 RepID=UPI000372470A|nr:hypothetical protein [Amycolatopsis nigrescens]
MKKALEPDAAAPSPDDTTRYLCVAARTDDKFADQLNKALFSDDLHAVAPSVDFSLRPVLQHCLAGRRQRLLRDAGLLGTTVVALIVAPLWTILALTLVMPAAGWFGRMAAQGGRPRHVLFAVLMIVALLYFSVQVITVLDVDPGARRSEQSGVPDWLIGIPVLALLTGLVLYGLVAWDLFHTRQVAARELTRSKFRQDEAPEPMHAWQSERLDEIERAERGNLTVYDGYNPFVGHGPSVSNWSFALPTLRRDGEAVALDVLELIEYVRERLRPIGPELGGLVLEDRVFISGNTLTSYRKFLPRRDQAPRQLLSADEIREIAAEPSGSARHYLCARVPSWGGEVVASTFLHFSTKGRLLYLQCERTTLGPLWKQYHDVDRLTDNLTAGQVGRLLGNAAGELTSSVLRAPGRVLSALLSDWRRANRRELARTVARNDLGYSYGARVSARQLAADTLYHNYFQKADADKHLKLIERHVLAAMLDFLDAHEVDTTEFRNRQMAILNQGIIQTGGISNVGSQAVGTEASISQQVTKPSTAEPAATSGT